MYFSLWSHSKWRQMKICKDQQSKARLTKPGCPITLYGLIFLFLPNIPHPLKHPLQQKSHAHSSRKITPFCSQKKILICLFSKDVLSYESFQKNITWNNWVSREIRNFHLKILCQNRIFLIRRNHKECSNQLSVSKYDIPELIIPYLKFFSISLWFSQ